MHSKNVPALSQDMQKAALYQRDKMNYFLRYANQDSFKLQSKCHPATNLTACTTDHTALICANYDIAFLLLRKSISTKQKTIVVSFIAFSSWFFVSIYSSCLLPLEVIFTPTGKYICATSNHLRKLWLL